MSSSSSDESEDLPDPTLEFAHFEHLYVADLEGLGYEQKKIGPTFAFQHQNIRWKWKLHVYPNGGEIGPKEHREKIGTFIQFVDGPRATVEVDFGIAIVKHYGQLNVTYETTCAGGRGQTETFNRQGKSIGDFVQPGLATLKKKDGYVDKQKRITIVVNIRVHPDKITMAKVLEERQVDAELEHQFEPCPALFPFAISKKPPAHGLHFTIVAGQNPAREFYCNADVLQNNCPMFQALFESKLEEQKERRLVMKDRHPDVVQIVIHFIYTLKVPENFPPLAAQVLDSAEYFRLPGLKWHCEQQMSYNLNPNNAVEYLILADRYNLILLRNMAVSIIADTYDSITLEKKKQLIQAKLDHWITDALCQGRRMCTNIAVELPLLPPK